MTVPQAREILRYVAETGRTTWKYSTEEIIVAIATVLTAAGVQLNATAAGPSSS